MRISSIDIGSNAIRQVIVEIDAMGTWTILKKHREAIRLGHDVFLYNKITDSTAKRVILAFKRMARLNRKYKAERTIALATSAFRDARNKSDILKQIVDTSGIKINVISGKQEALLIRRAVENHTCLNNEHCLLIDIGGGSVELTHVEGKHIHYSRSFKWGMVRTLTDSIFKGKSPQMICKENLQRARAQLPKRKFTTAVGTGGNLDALGKLKLTLLKKGPNTFLTTNELKLIYKKFQKMPAGDRLSKLDFRPDRVDVIEPAMFLTLQLMKKYGIKKIKLPCVGLKEGAIYSIADRLR